MARQTDTRRAANNLLNPSIRAHKHTFDLHPTIPLRVACSVCGFSVPLEVLKSKVNLDAMTARANATQAVRDLIEAQS